MERLTTTSDKGGVAFTFDLDITCDKSEIMKILKIAEKLKEYEDLEEQGKLPLPHVGDRIYFIVFGNNQESEKYENFIQSEEITSCFITKDLLSYTTKSKGFANSEIGKTVFLTKSEAENALQKMNEMEEKE